MYWISETTIQEYDTREFQQFPSVVSLLAACTYYAEQQTHDLKQTLQQSLNIDRAMHHCGQEGNTNKKF